MDQSDRIEIVLFLAMIAVFSVYLVQQLNHKQKCNVVLSNVVVEKKLFSIDPGNETDLSRARNYTQTINQTYLEDPSPPK